MTTQAQTSPSSTASPSRPVLVTGGTGKTGRRLAQRLSRHGSAVRIGSRSGQPPFSWDDPSTWGAALQGVDSVYLSYQPDLGFPGADETAARFARSAADAGARRLVLLSGRGEEGALAAERKVREAVAGTGAEWTILRCSWFDQNFDEGFFLDPVLAGELALPAGDAVEPFVDADDIADVAAAALTGSGHAGQVYELTGPRLMSFAEAAGEISGAAGRTIRYVPVTDEDFRGFLRENGIPEEFAGLFELIRDGRNAHLADGVKRALGRAPRDFADFARDAAATGVWRA
ncbi:NmrA family transcriptional regulator [Streptomonospora salina]|uniref:Uncharacterized protein YbjT (DUF2867 family) n=1 Tax=Streptomonospora salina TaxID=104205 RepID=A0A841E9N1_9ACTN|nr:NmrA family transcriptional regulator [Streptomonospora salina]MBB6000717.1 uncharacterized protein YbjT (DUF2867 family) [Streptomonospora salina]